LEGCRDERDFEHALELDRETGLAEIDDWLLVEDDSQPIDNAQENQQINDPGSNLPFDHVPPPSSGSKPFLYVIKQGNADVLCQTNFNPASLGPGTLFGEGGFLFERQHSASIVAAGPLECWVVDFETFLNDVLNSENLRKLFSQHAHRRDGQGNLYMTMDGFIQSCLQEEKSSEQSYQASSAEGLSIANAYNSILRSSALSQYRSNQIYLSDFCLFYLLISRPDPEVDIAFLLMDRHKTGSITKADFQDYLYNLPFYFDPESEFVQRYFGFGQTVRSYQFSQFLVDLQKEMGRQAFFHEAKQYQQEYKSEGVFLPAEEFVDLLKSTCGWRLPSGVVERLEFLYAKGAAQSAEATAMASVRAGTIKGDTADQVTDFSTRSVLSEMEHRKNRLGTRYFTYVDYTAFQEVLGVLPGIYNLIDRACEIKDGPISADDFKVANRVLGLGGRLSRRQVDIVFQLFDLDRDGYIAAEDVFGVCGVENAFRLEPAVGRGGEFTFAPPPKHHSNGKLHAHGADQLESNATDNFPTKPAKSEDLIDSILNQVTHFLLSSVAGGIAIATVYRE
jgi:Ca2+-binding EF-hand superfamily protein